MTLDRGTLANIDRRILSALEHEGGVQLVKVPVSDAAWSTWRRYCDAAAVSMGRAIAVLLQHELSSVIDEDFDHVREVLASREAELAERKAELTKLEKDLGAREEWVARRERRETGRMVEPADFPIPTQSEIDASVPKVGRNDPCSCGSGRKYKHCHGSASRT